MAKIVETDYYDLHDILSHNAMWNFIMGARGLGKTFDSLEFCINKFLHKGYQFIYLRRSEEEIKRIKPTFFDDMAKQFPAYEFQVEGMALQISRKRNDGKHDWKTMGFIIALSTSGNLKSVAFPDVRFIIFDEIFPNKKSNAYLSGEVWMFAEFYNTVDRYKDKTRVIALSNATSLANPYFSAYGIHMEQQHKAIQMYAKGYIAVEKADYKGFSSKVAHSRFGKFMIENNPDYAEYAINNKFQDDTKELIAPLNTSKDTYNYTIETDEGRFSIWSHLEPATFDAYYILSDNTPEHCRIKTTVPTRVRPDKPFLGKRDDIMKRLQTAYRCGRLNFETAELKAIFLNLFGSSLS